jgi:hypothetical protein
MTNGAQTREGWFTEVGWGFYGILVGSRVFLPSRWTMLEKVLGGSVVRCWFYLADKPLHVGVGVDGLAFPMHHPMTCSHQKRGQGLLPGIVLSYRCNGRCRLPGDVKPPGRGYLMECYHPGTRYWKPLGTASGSLGVSQAGLRGWVVTGVPRYLGYKTPTVALEPFVVRVVGVVRLTGSRIGTHMLLWVPSQDRVTTMVLRGMTGVVTCDRSRDLRPELGCTFIISVCDR